MRYLFLCLVMVSLIVMPCAGCGGGKPDPRDNADFIEDSDPSATMERIGGEDTSADAAKE